MATPTERELEILKILWRRGEATVREVYEEMSESSPIVQNTVQAFLRTMEEKELVTHRLEGRTFIYKPVPHHDETQRSLLSGLLQRVFDGAVDQLVQSALSLRPPTPEELAKLEQLIKDAKAAKDPKPARESRSEKRGER
jgi:BlaI family transcriptional regulator, penicillinase repressor